MKEGTPASRPVWRDPVVVIGAAVPAAILLAFAGYLWSERKTTPKPPSVAHEAPAAPENTPVAIADPEADPTPTPEEAEAAARLERRSQAFGRRAGGKVEEAKAAARFERRQLKYKDYQDTKGYRDTIDEAMLYFDNTRMEIVDTAASTMRTLRDDGTYDATGYDGGRVSDVVAGGIYLSKNTHYPDRSKMPDFATYCAMYRALRRQGLDFTEAIDKLDEMKKF